MPIIKPAQKHKNNTKQHIYTKQTLNKRTNKRKHYRKGIQKYWDKTPIL
jgi:hypothetical protein